MGLDISFIRRAKNEGEDYNFELLSEHGVVEGDYIGYLRKVNTLFGYAEENNLLNYDTDTAVFDHHDIERAIELYGEVLQIIEQKESGAISEEEFAEIAESKLPYTEGFFFGCYDYGEGYTSQVKAGYEELKKVYAQLDPTDLQEYVLVEFNY